MVSAERGMACPPSHVTLKAELAEGEMQSCTGSRLGIVRGRKPETADWYLEFRFAKGLQPIMFLFAGRRMKCT